MHAPSKAEYAGHDQLVAMREARRYNAMIEALIEHWLGPEHFLIDIGAGVGEFATRMSAHGHYVLAVEPDAAQRDIIRDHDLHCVSSVEKIGGESFHGAYSLNVLEHIEDDLGALRAWRRVLRPGGLLLLYVPAFPVLYGPMDRAVGHYRRYTRHSLQRVVEAAGFSVIHSRYADSLGFLASLALRLQRGDGTVSPGLVRFYDRYVFPFSRMLDWVVSPFFGKNVWLVAQRTQELT